MLTAGKEYLASQLKCGDEFFEEEMWLNWPWRPNAGNIHRYIKINYPLPMFAMQKGGVVNYTKEEQNLLLYMK